MYLKTFIALSVKEKYEDLIVQVNDINICLDCLWDSYMI